MCRTLAHYARIFTSETIIIIYIKKHKRYDDQIVKWGTNVLYS